MIIELLLAVGLCIFGYLCGSLPFAFWITKVIKGVDVRDAGSGHISTTNTIRQAGWVPGILVLILDMGKGFLPTFIANEFAPFEWVVPFTTALAVAGHCWPLFAQFRGGMGLATAAGSMLAIYPFGIPLALLILLPLTLILKHSARASLISSLLYAPLLFLFGAARMIVWVAAAMGIVLAIRFTIDWNREYRELWLDRDSS
jgi:glycerol-3-phosphate acyltransferase PlsY